MQRTAKIFMNNRSQVVRIPREFQFSTAEVYIRKEGEDVILSPRPSLRPKDWSALFAGPYASPDFMDGYEDLPVQERNL
jgi:antitoxin VapB